jgi:o-succinylbenzoate synthase
MRPITVEHIRLHPIGLPLVEALRTSVSDEPFKSAIIVELRTTNGVTGWGECPTKATPSYSYESMGTAQHVLTEFLIDALEGRTITSPTEVPGLLSEVRGHPMAKYAVEAAVWDAVARANDLPLAVLFAAHLPDGHIPRDHAVVGVSIGIQESIDKTLEIITRRLHQGYRRIKLKIKPGWDVELARGVREAYPDITLMLDANSAYTLDDAEHLRQLDEYDLLMLEQPLAYNDVYEHSKLQPQLKTPICLDESIHTARDAQLAVEIGACKIINLKPARVGGYTESLALYRFCAENDVPLWVGGLLETGIGRVANLAFASLPGVTMPSDISATDRYYDPDLTEPPFVLAQGSTIRVPGAPGIGVEVQRERLEEASARWQENYPYTGVMSYVAGE